MNQNVRSKTPTAPSTKRKSSLPDAITNTSRRSDAHTESFTARSPLRRQYSGGSTGLYYGGKAEKILQSAVNTSSSVIYKRVNLSATTSPSPRKSANSRFVDSPLKTLHTTRIYKDMK